MFTAFTCGLFGALASISGKFALSDSDFNRLLAFSSIFLGSYCPDYADGICLIIYWFVRFLMLLAMLTFNAMMISSFLSALETNSSIIATVISSAVNFLSTGFLGHIIFNEEVNLKWYFGSIWIIIGLLLIMYSQGLKRKISQ